MEKTDSSREVLTWSTLDRNILAIIFSKLDIMDLTFGASRVCIYWFLAAHNKTLWNTIDLAKFQYKGKQFIIYKHHPVDDEVVEALSLSNLLIKTTKYLYFLGLEGIKLSLTKKQRQGIKLISLNKKKREGIKLSNVLIEMTKLSSAATQNLLFNFYSYLEEKDLKLVAERMPNIEKLALPVSLNLRKEKSFRFAFSQWKNLKTLIMAPNEYAIWKFEFQVVGQNCSNLTNLKISSYLDKHNVVEIVRYLQSLKRLSLRCSFVRVAEVLSLIRGLGNLAVLNLTHCKIDPNTIDSYNVVQAEAATQKLEKVIICSQNDCKVCKDGPACMFRRLAFYEKNWRNDEIKELEF